MKTQKLAESTKCDFQYSLPLCHWSDWFSNMPEVIVVTLSSLNMPITNAYKRTYAFEGLERLKATAKRSKAGLTVGNIIFCQYF